MMNLLITFILLSIANVIIQTIKSIATIKCGKTVAAVVNAVAYGLYTFVIVYTNCELNIWLKAGITAAANFVGVWIVKYLEEKARKDKLWRIEAIVSDTLVENMISDFRIAMIPSCVIKTNDNSSQIIYYCATQKESALVKEVLKYYNAKFFVMEQNAIL